MKMPDFDLETFAILGLAMGGGAFGSAVRFAGSAERDLRLFATGIAAAFIMIVVTHPTDWVGLIAGSVAAGYASDAVLASYTLKAKLENAKLETQLAAQQAKKAKQQQNEAEADLGMAIGALKAIGSSGSLEMAGADAPTTDLAAQLEAAQKARAANV